MRENRLNTEKVFEVIARIISARKGVGITVKSVKRVGKERQGGQDGGKDHARDV